MFQKFIINRDGVLKFGRVVSTCTVTCCHPASNAPTGAVCGR